MNKAKKIQAFCENLALDFEKLHVRPKRSRLSVDKLGTSLGDIYAKSRQFSKGQHLGLLGKARFAYCLQGVLKRRGYQPSLVNKVVLAVILNALIRS